MSVDCCYSMSRLSVVMHDRVCKEYVIGEEEREAGSIPSHQFLHLDFCIINATTQQSKASAEVLLFRRFRRFQSGIEACLSRTAKNVHAFRNACCTSSVCNDAPTFTHGKAHVQTDSLTLGRHQECS